MCISSLVEVQDDVLPMQKNFVKVKWFPVEFNLGSHAVATQLEYNRFWIVFDAAYHHVFKHSWAFRVRPDTQLLQRTDKLSSTELLYARPGQYLHEWSSANG